MNTTKNRPLPSSRLDLLLAGRHEVKRYAELPRPHQLALAHYMAVDGEAWENLLKLPSRRNSKESIRTALIEALPRYVGQYGECLFGAALLPTRDVLASIIRDPELAGDWPDWKTYHAWYCQPSSAGGVPDHPRRNRWPVILSSTDDETLQDGWHRLHCYVRQGAKAIPAVFYPKARHMGSKAR